MTPKSPQMQDSICIDKACTLKCTLINSQESVDDPQSVPETEQNVVSLSETVLLLYSTMRNFVLHSRRQLFHAQLTPLTTKKKDNFPGEKKK